MLKEVNIIAGDLETGGTKMENFIPINPITQVAFIVINTKLEKVETYTNYVKPYDNLEITKQSLDYTGLKMTDIEAGIDVKKLYNDLKELFKKYKIGSYGLPILCGHKFATYDIWYLIYVFKKFNDNIYNYVSGFILDTLDWAKLKYGNEEHENYQLGTIASLMGVDYSDGHDASNDTDAQADLAIRIIKELRSGEVLLNEEIKERSRDKFYF